MPTITAPRSLLSVILVTATMPVCATANDDVRIGRYSVVTVPPSLTEIDTTATPQPEALPERIDTQAEAVEWLLDRYNYRLNKNSCQAFGFVEALAAPLAIRAPETLPGSLRLALHTLLGPRIKIVMDAVTREVVLSMSPTESDAQEEIVNEK